MKIKADNINKTSLVSRFHPWFFFILQAFLFSGIVYAADPDADVYFNPNFLSDDLKAVSDLSRFGKGQEVMPGTYRADIYVNDSFVVTRNVVFIQDEQAQSVIPCLTLNDLRGLGVKIDENYIESDHMHENCFPFLKKITDSSAHFDVSNQHLALSVPQKFMSRYVRGYIRPEMWDEGITSGLLNYSLTGNRATYHGVSNQSAYLNLRSGVNIGAWRLRNASSWSYSDSPYASEQSRWNNQSLYVSRDIPSIKSRLTAGDSFTENDIFSSISYRGIQVTSDESMLPDSLKGYAPVIHGVASGTAIVSIEQNGNEIYQATVPPGPFTINDLYATGSGGDLLVRVKEKNGRSFIFTVPWATVPLLQREGYTRYSVTAGRYTSNNRNHIQPGFVDLTAEQGLAKGWTLFGGSRSSERYQAVDFGSAKNLGVPGALSADITYAAATLPDESTHRGQSLRFMYSKNFIDTRTGIQLAGYRYSIRGYFTFADTTYERMSGHSELVQDGVDYTKPRFADFYNLSYNKREKLQIGATQQLGSAATLYVTGSHQSYWNRKSSDNQLQIGLSAAINDINCSLSYNLAKSAYQEGHEQLLALSLSIPFSHWMRSDSNSYLRNANAGFSTSQDSHGHSTNLAGVNGTLLEDNNMSYSLQAGQRNSSGGSSNITSYSALNYRGGQGVVNAGYSYGSDYRQVFYGVSGGAVAHENGITFSQPFNDTVVLIRAPTARNVSVENQTGVRTDWRGYAVLPYATEYRRNQVSLNTTTLPANVELDESIADVIPTQGAVVRADFRVHTGLKILMTLRRENGRIPFGATVIGDKSQSSGIIDEDGLVYLSGMPPHGSVKVTWGKGHDKSCIAKYDLSQAAYKQALIRLSALCRGE